MENGFIVADSFRNDHYYGGVTKKFGITVDGENYIVKFSVKGLSTQIYSEYVASRFIRNLGVPAQEVWIGTYDKRMVNIIKDFKRPGESLHAFSELQQSSVDTVLDEKLYTYADVLHLIESHTKMSPHSKELALKQFWDQFVCDAILANRDRHQGNWGYLSTAEGYVPAPLYDNGGSLFPDMGTAIKGYVQDRFKFLSERSERFPASLLLEVRDTGEAKRTNYYEMCGRIKLPDWVVNLSLQDMWRAICDATDYVIDPYRDFYRRITCMRFLHIIRRFSMEESYGEICNL